MSLLCPVAIQIHYEKTRQRSSHLWPLGELGREDAVVELRHNLLLINRVRQVHRALVAAIIALHPLIGVLLFLMLEFLLALDCSQKTTEILASFSGNSLQQRNREFLDGEQGKSSPFREMAQDRRRLLCTAERTSSGNLFNVL